MVKITSVVVRFGALVTFKDGSSGIMHGQAEGKQAWSIDKKESFETARQASWFMQPNAFLYPYYDAINAACQTLPGITNFDWDFNTNTMPASQKEVTDMSGRLDIILTGDNQKTASVAIIFKGTKYEIYLGGDTDIDAGIDFTPFITQFKAAMEQAMEQVAV
jgi:hypothetical protein